MMTITSASALDGGFADPVRSAQSVFHDVMQAMARPGSIRTLSVEIAPPAPLAPGLAAIALTLADADTPVWLSPVLDIEPVTAWLAFHCGCAFVSRANEAQFLLVDSAQALPDFGFCQKGSQEYPDRSATVVLDVPSLDKGASLRLEGPGIDGATDISPVGMPGDFLAMREANRALFPCGVDHILTCENQIIALPRSTRVAAAHLEEVV